ncbi:MAG: hypothetical protein HZB53_00225 [Chloroflexi bacterium]|nr:hypothetical protein [Chloroflexota bacterium]
MNLTALPRTPDRRVWAALAGALFLCLFCMAAAFAANGGAPASPTPSAAPMLTATPTNTDVPTPEPAATPLPAPTSAATATNAPTSTPSATPTATQTPTAVPTGTDTPTVTPTSTPRPTATPTRTYTPTPAPNVQISAKPNPLELGGCSTLYWAVDNVQAVYVFGGDLGTTPLPVGGHDSRDVCPRVDTTYTLRFITAGRTQDVPYVLDVHDTTPPPVPALGAPSGGLASSGCSANLVTLYWKPVSDLSGVLRYEWRIYKRVTLRGLPLELAIASGSTTAISVTPPGATFNCDTYYWSVRAVDRAGNLGLWAAEQSYYFYIALR